MTENRTWDTNVFTGGPADQIFVSLRQVFPELDVRRLVVTHVADDDNVWLITRPPGSIELQLDSMPNGQPPFLLESNADRARTDDVDEAVGLLTSWLRHNV